MNDSNLLLLGIFVFFMLIIGIIFTIKEFKSMD